MRLTLRARDALPQRPIAAAVERVEIAERAQERTVEALERGRTVKLSGFGVFQVRAKRERMGRNPKTGEPAAIDPRRVIAFRASQVMKARIDRALAK